MYILYAHDKLDKTYALSIKANERYEQCVGFLDNNMMSATNFLLSKSISRDLQKLQKFIDGAVQDFIQNIKAMDECVLSSAIKKNIVETLNNTVLFSADSVDLEDFYGDLNLNGTENHVYSLIEINKFKRKIIRKRPELLDDIENAFNAKISLLRGPKTMMCNNNNEQLSIDDFLISFLF